MVIRGYRRTERHPIKWRCPSAGPDQPSTLTSMVRRYGMRGRVPHEGGHRRHEGGGSQYGFEPLIGHSVSRVCMHMYLRVCIVYGMRV